MYIPSAHNVSYVGVVCKAVVAYSSVFTRTGFNAFKNILSDSVLTVVFISLTKRFCTIARIWAEIFAASPDSVSYPP